MQIIFGFRTLVHVGILRPLNVSALLFCSSTSIATFSRPSKPIPFLPPNRSTLAQLLKQRPTLNQLKQTHAQVITQAFSQDSSLIAALIRSYTSSDSEKLCYARFLFDHYPCPSPPILLWNLMIRAYSKIPSSRESLCLFHRMLVLDAPMAAVPDNYTFTFLITSCSHQNLMVYGENIHGQVIKSGFESDVFVGNSLVNMYSVFVKMEESQKFFDEMPHRDVFTWTSLLGGYIKLGAMGTATELFSEMPERNDVSWAVMIAGYLSGGRYTAALRCFHDMLCDDNVKPNETVLVCVLSACAHIGALDQGKWVHAYIDRTRVWKSSNISTALIDMYAKCGRIGCAAQVFNAASDRDVLTWTSMITGLSIHGLGKDALQVFSQMVDEGLKPNNVTLVGVLNGCSHSGLVDEGWLTFHNMDCLWGISPTIEHYGCLIDLLGRAGRLEQAFDVAKSMPMKPDVVIWRALLSACRVHGNIFLGERIMDYVALQDHISNSGGHVLLSNLYASLGQWESVAGLRKLMSERRKETIPGCSWIEVGSVVYEFRIDDQLHPQIEDIQRELREILRRASIEGGYVANVKQVSFDLIEEEKEQAVSLHSEKLAIAFGLMSTEAGSPIRIVKNLRTCEDCHSAIKAISRVYGREIIVRDRSRFHTFSLGICSCKDYW